MKYARFKVFLILLILLLLDFLKPLGYSLRVEFILLGILFICFRTNLLTSISFGLIFGYFKDTLSLSGSTLSLIEFPCFCLIINYLLKQFRYAGQKIPLPYLRNLIVISMILVHVLVNAALLGRVLVLFSLQFLLQSFVFYLLIDYLLRKLGISFRLTAINL